MSEVAFAPARFSAADSLVEVDASLSLADIARRCQEAGWIFPLPGPPPSLSLSDACARMPFLVDAYVASAEAVTGAGLPLSTGRAPRAATGPDLLGALCSSPALATCVRARVRLLLASSARGSVERFQDVAGALALFSRLLDEGRAFAALAARHDGGFRVAAIGGPAALPDAAPARGDELLDDTLASFTRARSLVPGDLAGLRERLEAGAPLVAAPLMGRVAMLIGDGATAGSDGGVASFVDGLLRAGARHG